MTEKQTVPYKMSLSEVARAAGVSNMTASRVMRDAGGYSGRTRALVLEKLDKPGFLPNRLAAVFKGEASSTFVGASIPDPGCEVFSQVLEGIDGKLGAFGHQTVLGLTQHAQQAEADWIRTVLTWQPAGLILTGRCRALEMRATPMCRWWRSGT